MAVQETTNAALASRSCSPGHLENHLYTRQMELKESDSNEEITETSKGKVKHRKVGAKPEEKENLAFPNGLVKIAPEKLSENVKKVKNMTQLENGDEELNIYVSDEVVKQLRSNTDDKEKRQAKQMKRKQTKQQRRVGGNNKEERETVINEQAKKKWRKPSLHHKNNAAINKSKFIENTDEMEVLENNRDNDGNKAENNNWMVDYKKSGSIENRIVLQQSQTGRNSTYMDNIDSDDMCIIDRLKNGSGQSYEVISGTLDYLGGKEFKRADSSDDSGCFSNVSVHSGISSGSDSRDEQQNMSLSDKAQVVSGNKQVSTGSSGLCSVCGHEPHGNESGLCKTCISRKKNDGMCIGAFGELRAYAKSIAHTVKKILSISPGQNQDVLHTATSPTSVTGNRKFSLPQRSTNTPGFTGAQLQKCNTQIARTQADKVPSGGLMKKSLSFDRRAAAHLEDNNRDSPVYWISQNKQNLPNTFSTLIESDEDKMRGKVDNASDSPIIDADYFSPDGKELKPYTDHDYGDGTNAVDKGVRKAFTKQVSCIEKTRHEGEQRNIYSFFVNPAKKYISDESKITNEVRRGRNRTARADTDYKSSQKTEDEMNALNVFRLKVIHEGSPVDPLNTLQRRKDDDLKDRRAVFMRSATAPNKNYMPKKDGGVDDRTKGLDKLKRSNTKSEIKTNRDLIPDIKETVEEEVRGKHRSIYDSYLESWVEDTCIMSTTPMSRRRSSSYNGRKAVSSKRSDLQRSISRSAVNRDNKNGKGRVITREKASAMMNTRGDGNYNDKAKHTFQYSSRADKYQTENSPSKRGAFMDKDRSYEHEHSNNELPYNFNETVALRKSTDEDNMQLIKQQYYHGEEYYSEQKKKEMQLSPVSQELTLNKRNAESLNMKSYYCEIDPQGNRIEHGDYNSPANKENLKFKSQDDESIFTVEGNCISYNKQIQGYGADDAALGKDSLWYQSEKRALAGRDGFYESKSSNSFHVATMSRSSYSDVALMKYQNSLDYVPSRRQVMYSETDVDTGLIYHFSKRQTTRAHVPAYHDFTSASKDIYTMSGDVSRSASSDSAVSTASDVSDSDYTGGFFTHDPFYNNESTASTSKSRDSHVHLYFEPNIATKREPSEVDIYTGAIFSSSQNAMSLGKSDENDKKHSLDVLKNGSTNNSTRLPHSRMSRRLRYRPHIDVITFKMAETNCEFLTNLTQKNKEIVADFSNNSSNWCEDDNINTYIYQETTEDKVQDTSYAEYKKVLRAAYEMKTVEKKLPTIDLLKYDKLEMSSKDKLFYTASQSQSASHNDSIWYSGVSDHMGEESVDFGEAKNQADPSLSFSWQRNDSYYQSSQRPIVNRSNNCRAAIEEAQQEISNTNNNRFEEFYTGFFEPSATKSPVAEHVNNSARKPSSNNWYSEHPARNNSSADFYGDYSSKSEASKTSPGSFEQSDREYSSSCVFGQANAAYSGSRTYMNQSAWPEYDKVDISCSNNYVDEPPKLRKPMEMEASKLNEKYSYFQYSTSPAEGSYRYDKKDYGFDQATPSPGTDVNGIRKVGGIVCRENVVNKEDYAEDVNRDLEQGAWMPFSFRHEDKARHQEDVNTNRSDITETLKAPVLVNMDKHVKHFDESSYNQDLIYDNVGARNKWREMKMKSQPITGKKREQSPKKASSIGDTKKQEHIKTGAWNPPDQIPDKARGRRPAVNTSKMAAQEDNKANTNVISSVTSIPSRLTSYVRRWF